MTYSILNRKAENVDTVLEHAESRRVLRELAQQHLVGHSTPLHLCGLALLPNAIRKLCSVVGEVDPVDA